MPVFFFWKSSLLSHLSHKPSACQPLCLVCVVSWPLSVVICAVDSVFQSPRGILCIQGARGGRLLGRTVGVWWEGANWRPQSRRLMRRRQPPPSGVTQHSNAEEGGQKSPALHPHSKHERIGKVYPIFNLQVSVWFESSAAGCSFHTEENEVAHVVGGQLGGFKQPILMNVYLCKLPGPIDYGTVLSLPALAFMRQLISALLISDLIDWWLSVSTKEKSTSCIPTAENELKQAEMRR